MPKTFYFIHDASVIHLKINYDFVEDLKEIMNKALGIFLEVVFDGIKGVELL